MKPQSKNPIVGYLPCPTSGCGCACTVHQVGAHKAATTGEPPKNKRRLGQYYTLCEKCGADQRSGEQRQIDIKNNMVETEAEALSLTVSASPKAANDAVILEAVNDETDTVVTEPVTEVIPPTEAEPLSEDKPQKTVNPVVIGGAVALLLGAIAYVMNKSKTKPPLTESPQHTQGL